MVKFVLSPSYSQFSFENCNVHEAKQASVILRNCSSAKPNGYKFMPAYRRKVWDGNINLIRADRIPTGLVSTAVELLKIGKIQSEVVDTIEYPKIDESRILPDMFDGITLRDYQLNAAWDLLRAKRGIAKLATNAGKTEIMCALCAAIEGNILILTVKKDILFQTAERIEQRLGERAGILGAGMRQYGRINIGMIQTLATWDEIAGYACVIYDECHHLSSKTSQKVYFTVEAPLRFGFSGTPLKNSQLEDLQLIAATGPIVANVSNKELIERKISANPLVEMHSIHDEHDSSLTYQEAYDANIIHNLHRNEIIAREANWYGMPTLILVERLEHGQLLQDAIPRSVFVHGSDDVETRKDALSLLRTGHNPIVIATDIFSEGVDVVNLRLLILAGAGKSYVKLIQKVGRALRTSEDKTSVRIVDFIDDTNEYLLQHSYDRAQIYESEGFEVKVSEE